MTKKFSTTSSTPIDNPLNDLPFVFYDEFDPKNNEPPTNTIVTSPLQPTTDINNRNDVDNTDSNEQHNSESNLDTTIDYSDINTDDLTIIR